MEEKIIRNTKQTLYQVMKIDIKKIYKQKDYTVVKSEDGSNTRVYNIPSSFTFSYDYDKALKNDDIVSIGDNLVFQKLRDIKGEKRTTDEIYDYVSGIKTHIVDIGSVVVTKDNKKELIDKKKKLEDDLKDILFIDDIVNVKVSNKEYYKEIALNKFTLNNITYKRFCCGSGQMRRNTVTFINEKYYDEMFEMLMCGLWDMKKDEYGKDVHKLNEIILAKLSAYFALSFSSVLWLKRKPRFCVIHDLETVLENENIDFIEKDIDTGKKKVIKTTMTLPMNSCDGEGIVDPEFAKLMSEDIGVGYTCCEFIVRTPFIKGCLLSFDFKKYIKEVCNKNTIESIYGEVFDIDEVDVILTESMFKMHDYYNSCKEYQDYHDKYDLKWGVARYNKKKDDDYSYLNYQYIQNNDLTNEEDLKELIRPTEEWLKQVCSGDEFSSIMYSIGACFEDETFDDLLNNCSTVHTKAIMKNSNMLKDGYIKKKIYNSIKESFKQAKIGRIWCRGNYQFMLADPIPLLRNAVGLDATGLIPRQCVYSNYWSRLNVDKLDLMRSPMVDRHEHNLCGVYKPKDINWYEYLYSGIVYSIYDTSTIRHSDSDFDGDICFSTDNKQLIKGAYFENNPITYDKEKAKKKEITYENIIDCDMNGFDTLVGQITNNSTSLNAMLPLFTIEEKPNEHIEILTRLKLLREIIGAEIDKIKLGVSPEFPDEWINRVKINEDDSEEEKQEKMKRNSMVICKKPYFMIYLYDKLYTSFINHRQQFNLDCLNKFNCKLSDLKYKKNKTKEEIRFINRYNYFSPVLDSPCIMNRICHKFEALDDEISSNKNFDNSIILDFYDKTFSLEDEILVELCDYYKKYKSNKKFQYVKQLMSDVLSKDEFAEYINHMNNTLIKEYREKIEKLVGTNTFDKFNALCLLSQYIKFDELQCEEFNKKKDKETKAIRFEKFDFTFIWDMMGNDILEVIPQADVKTYVYDEKGDLSYLGKTYKLVTLNEEKSEEE